MQATSKRIRFVATSAEKADEQQAAKSEKELVFPHFDDGFVPSESLLSMVLGPLPEGFDIDKELELMWEERAK